MRLELIVDKMCEQIYEFASRNNAKLNQMIKQNVTKLPELKQIEQTECKLK